MNDLIDLTPVLFSHETTSPQLGKADVPVAHHVHTLPAYTGTVCGKVHANKKGDCVFSKLTYIVLNNKYFD